MKIVVSFVRPKRIVECRDTEEMWTKAWRIYRLRQVDRLLEAVLYSIGL